MANTLLNTQTNIINEVLVRSNRATTNSFISDAMLKTWYVQAVRTAVNYHKWPFAEGRVSTTFASLVTSEDGFLRGEYPEGWKVDSIRLLTINGHRVDKKDRTEFRNYLEDNSAATDRIYTDFGTSYYINPNIDVNGTVTCWGQFTPYIDITDDDPSSTTGITPFSFIEEEGNEAIIEFMLGYLRTREEKEDEAGVHRDRAMKILDEIWKRYEDEQYQYQTTRGDGWMKRLDIIRGDFFSDTFKRNQF